MPNDLIVIQEYLKKCQEVVLDTSSVSVEAYEYLTKKRNLSQSSLEKFEIGFAHRKFLIPNLVKHFGENNLDEIDSMSDSFLGPRDFSFFIKDRIIVPIKDEFGEIISFATRSFFNPSSQWWNAPFQKGQHLYNLNLAKKEIFKKNKVYVVEGYMDAMILSQNGLENVCAVMGANLSHVQIGRILRYCNNVCFCFDWDKNKSGQKAIYKAVNTLKSLNIFDDISYINNLPLGQDPDDYVSNHGLDKFLSHEKIVDFDFFESEFKEILA